jgi:hypothetical protein
MIHGGAQIRWQFDARVVEILLPAEAPMSPNQRGKISRQERSGGGVRASLRLSLIRSARLMIRDSLASY